MFIDDVKLCPKKLFYPGDTIVEAGDSTDYLYYLERGTCCRLLTTEKGNEYVFEIRNADDGMLSLIGLTAALDRNNVYTCGFNAMTECLCHIVPRSLFLDYYEHDTDFLHEVIAILGSECKRMYEQILAHSESTIANYLCHLIYSLSEARPDNTRFVPLKYSNELLSKMTGVTTVTVARVITALKNAGAVRREHGLLIITDVEKLIDYGEGMPLKYH